jgi:hypothetical protein
MPKGEGPKHSINMLLSVEDGIRRHQGLQAVNHLDGVFVARGAQVGARNERHWNTEDEIPLVFGKSSRSHGVGT